MSTYSSNLKIELIGTGEQTGTWGTTTNSNFSNVFEQSIVGRVAVNFATDANKTLSTSDSVASQDFRNVYLNLTSSGSLTVTRDLIVPTINKNYVIQNNTTGGQSIRVITAAGTGITVPNGTTCAVYVDGTNVIQASDYAPTFTVGSLNVTTLDLTNLEVTNIKAKDGTASASIADSTGVMTIASSVLTTTDINGGTIDGTTVGASTASTGAFTSLSASGAFSANGGATLGDASGDALTINSSAVSIPNGLNFASNNFVITTAGNIGVGTASPASTSGRNLTIGSIESSLVLNTTSNRSFSIASGGNYQYTASSLVFYDNTAGSARMVINASGDVGIGTVFPAQKLVVSGTGTVSSRTNATDATGDASFFVGNNDGKLAGPLVYGSTKTAYGALGSNETAFYSNASTTIMADGASQVIKFATGGNAERMRITSDGNVGIGTSSPSAKVTVVNNAPSVATGQILAAYTGYAGVALTQGSLSEGYLWNINNSFLSFGTNSTERMRLDASGNLGLGVTPSAWSGVKTIQLTNAASSIGIYGSGLNEFGAVSNTYYNGTNWIYATSTTSARYAISGGKHEWYNAPSGTAGNAITFTQAMTLDASGRLGIGTTSPQKPLDVNGRIQLRNERFTIVDSDGTTERVNLWDQSNATSLYAIQAGSSLVFGTASTERARIDSSGNLMVNRTSRLNNGKLEVLATSSQQAIVAQVQTNGNSLFQGFNAAGTAVFVATGDGDLVLTRNLLAAGVYTNVLGATNRDVFVDNLGNFGYIPSVRASKTEINNITDTSWLYQLNPVSFKYRKKNEEGNYTEEIDGDIQYGLIAEDVEQVRQDLCFYDVVNEQKELRGVQYSKLTTVLLKAIQELKAEVDALKAQLNK